jgi:iron complex outermembrane receptor protein
LDNHTIFGSWDGSYSAFGQLTWHLDDKLSLVGGLRYTYEDKYGSSATAPAGTYAPLSAIPLAQQASATKDRNTVAPVYNYTARWAGGNLSGTASLDYQWDDDLMTYLTYSRGFQSAGLNLAGVPSTTPTVVAPEYVNSYEAGAKSNLLDNRLTLNGDLFWTDVSNFQATIYDTSLGGRTYIANAGGVRSRGAELDLRAIPLQGLSLTVSGVYDDAIYTSLNSTTCPYLQSYQTSCSLTGQQLAGVSHWAGTFTGEYAHSVAQDIEAYFGGDWTARTGYYSQLNDDIFSHIAGYGTINLHVGIRNIEQRWDLSLWSTNLLNQNYYTALTPSKSFGYTTGALGDPRFFGMTLRLKI